MVEVRRRIIHDCLQNAPCDLLTRVQPLDQRRQRTHRLHAGAQRRHRLQRLAQRDQVARGGLADHQPVGQSLQIADGAQALTQLCAQQLIRLQRRDRIQPRIQAPEIEQRLCHPGAQQARAHRRHRAIEDAQQAAPPAAGAHSLGQLQVAPRVLIEHHELRSGIRVQSGELRRTAALRLQHVGQQRARRPHPRPQFVDAEAGQRAHPEMRAQHLVRRARLEVPVVHRREMDAGRQGRAALCPAAGQQHFARGQPGELLDDTGRRAFASKLRHGKFAGRHVGVGQPAALPAPCRHIAHRQHRQQVVVLVFAQQAGFCHRPRCDHPRHLALDQPFAVRLGHLLAHGDVMPLFDQPGDVALHRMIGHARHRHALVLADRAAGQHQIKLTRCRFGITIERLVEVAQAEQHDAVRIVLLDVEILLAKWGDPGRRGWAHLWQNSRRLGTIRSEGWLN